MLCSSVLERHGGAFGCCLPVGHEGPHGGLQPRKRGRFWAEEPEFGAQKAPARTEARYCRPVSTPKPPPKTTAPSQGRSAARPRARAEEGTSRPTVGSGSGRSEAAPGLTTSELQAAEQAADAEGSGIGEIRCPPCTVHESGGYELYLSPRSITGYEGVGFYAKLPKPYAARLRLGATRYEHIGWYTTAVEAAVAYATAVSDRLDKALDRVEKKKSQRRP